MERILKFRAWFTDGKHKTMPGQACSMQDDKTLLEFLQDIEDCKEEHGYNVILMQYTGLKDKNGKEIYEGDVIQSNSELVNIGTGKGTGRFKTVNYEVRWQEDEGKWGRWNKGKFESLTGLQKSYLVKWYEVIGNIYEKEEI